MPKYNRVIKVTKALGMIPYEIIATTGEMRRILKEFKDTGFITVEAFWVTDKSQFTPEGSELITIAPYEIVTYKLQRRLVRRPLVTFWCDGYKAIIYNMRMFGNEDIQLEFASKQVIIDNVIELCRGDKSIQILRQGETDANGEFI